MKKSLNDTLNVSNMWISIAFIIMAYEQRNAKDQRCKTQKTETTKLPEDEKN